MLPPPNVTGILHVGHVLGDSVQDLLCRWKRMKGFNVSVARRDGPRGHRDAEGRRSALLEQGIPKDALGREKFLEVAGNGRRSTTSTSSSSSRPSAPRSTGRARRSPSIRASRRAVREVFVRLYDKGLIYREDYIVNWCPSCGTAISDEEVDFVETHGKLYYIAYPFAGRGVRSSSHDASRDDARGRRRRR